MSDQTCVVGVMPCESDSLMMTKLAGVHELKFHVLTTRLSMQAQDVQERYSLDLKIAF